MLLKAGCASKVKRSSSASEQNIAFKTKAKISEEMDDVRDKAIYLMRLRLGT